MVVGGVVVGAAVDELAAVVANAVLCTGALVGAACEPVWSERDVSATMSSSAAMLPATIQNPLRRHIGLGLGGPLSGGPPGC
jgi:hypothetical protein